MVARFVDSDTGTAVSINPEYMMSLRQSRPVGCVCGRPRAAGWRHT